tara:strand:+ start:1116 stop:1355 length:240 start_codon:yes stop_codon:yes gene_type:complete
MFAFNKLSLNVFFNSCLFLILIIGIQNSSNKLTVNLIIEETIPLPISFIIGTSFISGSIFGSLLPLNIHGRKNGVSKSY